MRIHPNSGKFPGQITSLFAQTLLYEDELQFSCEKILISGAFSV